MVSISVAAGRCQGQPAAADPARCYSRGNSRRLAASSFKIPASPGATAIRPLNELAEAPVRRSTTPNLEARYRALVEQIPAVVFMAYLDQGIGEAYVSPQIEAAWVSRRRMAGGSGSLVSADSSGRQRALEHRSGGDVPVRQTAALGLPGNCSRWTSNLVSLRSEDDPRGRRASRGSFTASDSTSRS